MPSILFVDDEPGVLDGLRRQLRRHRDRWVMRFAVGGDAALAALAEAPADILVTDVRMPGVDGLSVLREARDRYPDMTRIVLSGYAPPNEERAVFQLAHRVLPKPCEHEFLVTTLEQSLELRSLIADKSVAAVVGGVERLPSVPQVYTELVSILEDPDSDATRVARVIERDPVLVASVLRVANSAALAPSESIARVRDAVTFLGRRMISSMVLGVAVMERFRTLGIADVIVRRFQADAMATANLASRLADRRDRDDAFTAGMLHDLGQLVLLSAQGAAYRPVFAQAQACGTSLCALERERLGTSHDRAGAFLLGLWGLPYAVVMAVATHHVPLTPEALHDPPVSRAVRLAVQLVARAEAKHVVTAEELGTWEVSEPERVRIEGCVRELFLPVARPTTTTTARPMTYRMQRRH